MDADKENRRRCAYRIADIREIPELKGKAARWFCDKWDVPEQEYLMSMSESLTGKAPVPRWYVAVKTEEESAGDAGSAPDAEKKPAAGSTADGVCSVEIIAGAGIIENDFHVRKDLSPNICALYVDERYRCRGIAGELLTRACCDMSDEGIDKIYLVTDHTSFYERYGWEFIGMVEESAAGGSSESAADERDERPEQVTIRMYARTLD